MKKRSNKWIIILLTLALLLQGIALPVSAEETPNTESVSHVESELETDVSESTELSEATEDELEEDLLLDATDNETIQAPEPTEAPDEDPSEDEPVSSESEETEVSDAEEETIPSETTEEPKSTDTPEPTDTPAPTDEPAPTKAEEALAPEPSQTEEEIEGAGITPTEPIIGPMFVGLELLLPQAMNLNSTTDSGLVTSKTATYNPSTGQVDFRFDIYSLGEVSTIVSTKPTDIVLVLDQSGSMAYNFGSEVGLFPYSGGHSDRYTNRNNLWVLVDGEYYKVTVERRSINWISYEYRYSYTVPGQGLVSSSWSNSSNEPNWSFYLETTQAISRRQALINAVTEFSDIIAAKAVEDPENPVAHRISMVGFASTGSSGNTQVLTTVSGGSVNYLSNGYVNAATNSLMDVTNATDRGRITDAISRIQANGATSTNLGMEMAKDVLDRTATTASGRDRIVVMLTDGVPTTQSAFSTTVANGAIGHARTIKNLGHPVFTIGIFPDADNSTLPSNSNNNTETQNANRFMHLVSSNYPNATAMNNAGNGGNVNRGYYFSDADPEALYETFNSISQTIGNTNTELTADTSMIDYLIPQLSPPINENSVLLSTAAVTGFTVDGDPIFGSESSNPPGVVASVNQSEKRVSVTGFSYKDHYVAQGEDNSVRGSKLIVRFSADVDPDFIGGNKIYPNLPSSGVYLPPEGSNPPVIAEPFEQPNVDIPLRFDFDTNPKAIYLTNSIEPWKLLKDDATLYKIGTNEYSFNGENNEYVDIVYTVTNLAGDVTYGTYTILAGKDSGSWSGNAVAPETLTEYKIKATVTPINGGTHDPMQKTKNDFVHVYVPELAPSDTSLYLTQTTNLMNRVGSVAWTALSTGAPAAEGTVPLVNVSIVNPLGSNPISHGGTAAFKPDIDSFFDLKLDINSVDVTSKSVITATASAALKDRDFSVFLFFPSAIGTDETIWLGETTNINPRMQLGPWTTATGTAPLPSGAAPTVVLTHEFVSGSNPSEHGGPTSFAAKEDSRFKIRLAIGGEDVTAKATITHSPDGTGQAHHFTIFVKTGSLTIKKAAAEGTTIDPNQSFLFDVTGPNGKTWTIAIQGTGERTITGLAIGTYTIEENTDWSWRYEPDEAIKSVQLTRGVTNANRTVTFTNSKDDDSWLSGETFAINVEGIARTAGVILGVLRWIGGIGR